jgi:hypothetical protein
MNETEWLSSTNPVAMLRSLAARYAAHRRRGDKPNLELFRSFACACCRRVWDLLDSDNRRAIVMIEAYAQNPVPGGLRTARRARWAAGNKASDDYDRLTRAVPRDRRACLVGWARNIASSAVWQAADKNPVKAANCHLEVAQAAHSVALSRRASTIGPDPGFIGYKLPHGGELAAQAVLLRNIMANPFRSQSSSGPREVSPNQVASANRRRARSRVVRSSERGGGG